MRIEAVDQIHESSRVAMATELDLDKILADAPEAVPLPQTAMEILKKSSLPQTSAKDLATILRTDQALSARVLKVANSAFYSLPRQIASINDAVVLLGIRTIRNLALTASMSAIAKKAVPGYGLPKGELFSHSLVMAQAASQVSKETNKAVPDEAYTAGLLHDIGKLVMSQHVQPFAADIAGKAVSEGVTFATAEGWLFGLNHADIGAALAEKWNLPVFLAGAIKLHHGLRASNGELTEATPLAAACILANHLARGLGSGRGEHESPDPPIPGAILEILNISAEGLPDLEVTVKRYLVSVTELTEGQ